MEGKPKKMIVYKAKNRWGRPSDEDKIFTDPTIYMKLESCEYITVKVEVQFPKNNRCIAETIVK